MAAGIANLTIESGATYQTSIIWKDVNGNPFNLTGYTVSMWFKTGTTSADVVKYQASSTGPSPAIVITPLAGQISITIPYLVTATFPVGQNLVYDLMLVNTLTTPPTVTRLLTGSVEVVPVITAVP